MLDAFAGSGALGFEAASRGAAEVLLLERDAGLVRSLRESARRLQATGRRVEAADAIAWMSRAPSATFDLVLLDPPFDARLHEPAIAASAPLVKPGGFIYIESRTAARRAGRLRAVPRLARRRGALRVVASRRHNGPTPSKAPP